MNELLAALSLQLSGELYYDTTMRTLYATDASAYREMPLAVAMPKHEADIKQLIAFALRNNTALIPRTAGTSLAGQVVGNGIIVDVSKYFTQIIEVNAAAKWVRVQPGVIRDDLNFYLKPYGLMFGPETSTANRAMIGGMVGNNSCGSNSVVYKSTREHIIEIKAILSDGSEAIFGETDIETFHNKCRLDTLEGRIYNNIQQILGNEDNRIEIEKQFPKKTIERRNTGYAIDILMQTAPFETGGPNFNFSALIAGSEGTLAFITEIKLNLVPLPPKETGLLCIHFNTIHESLLANLIALQFAPTASELIDHYILECTKGNIEQQKNRFFVQGDPGAILVVEFKKDNREEITALAAAVEAAMRERNLGYHFPLLFGDDTKKIWNLRKAGLGLLGNMPGDDKAVPVIEDTAVDVQDLPAYIQDFNAILKKYNLYAVHYAHAGSGELHLRPIINLKTAEGNALFRTIATEVAALVKQYNGSLSGEHGDGRLRGEFIPTMIGAKNYALLKQIKATWDPHYIFNPGKIVDTPSMNSQLRYTPGQKDPKVPTVFRWGNQTILQHAEQCNGSGDCRKTHLSGGTMCPSFMATRNEKDTTRARANILREFLTNSSALNKFNHKKIYEVMDLCLSCKGCKSECPSNVDVAKLKAEFLQQYYNANGIPLRSKLIAHFSTIAKLGSLWPSLYNSIVTHHFTGNIVKKMAGFSIGRSMPTLSKITVRQWMRQQNKPTANLPITKKVYLFCDEFTNYNDASIGITAIRLLEKLGYTVIIPNHVESGRAMLSKGLLYQAKKIAHQNIEMLSPIVTKETPLIGIEPSAILTFRDEYIDLADDAHWESAKTLAKHVFYIDEFLAREIKNGNITAASFTQKTKQIYLHGHCQQKALTNLNDSVKVLSLPTNYTVSTIPSGCCGMAGSFGYEQEHFELSMQIGNLVLFPAVTKADTEAEIAAPGTSCRHQIKDGTGKKAKHTVEILWEALA
jgi:FAD/FMN-containing dehydrogenase/Fe-S oxidoreductase